MARDSSSQVGYGYTISTVNNDPKGNSLTADLNLVKTSSVFGPDIPHLNLVARLKAIIVSTYNLKFTKHVLYHLN